MFSWNKTTLCHNPEDHNFIWHCHENLKTCTFDWIENISLHFWVLIIFVCVYACTCACMCAFCFFGVVDLCYSPLFKASVYIAQHGRLNFPIDNILDDTNFWCVKEYFAYLDIIRKWYMPNYGELEVWINQQYDENSVCSTTLYIHFVFNATLCTVSH